MQTSMLIAVYEGERFLVKDNHLIAKFLLTGIKRYNWEEILKVEITV